MQIHKSYRLLSLACIVLILVASGCFQQAGSGLQELPIAQDAGAGPTFTPPPSETPIPLPTEVPTEQPTLELPTATFEQAVAAVPSATQDLFQVQPLPTETPGLAMGMLPFPTETATPEGVAIAQAPTTDPNLQNIDPIFITATFIVQRATEVEAANMTATAGGSVLFLTATPAPTEFIVQPGVPTATQPIVAGADCIHEVRVEDRNLYRISLAYGVQLMDIARASGIVNPNMIVVGQKLTIPGCGTTGLRPPATSTPTGGGLNQGGGGVVTTTQPPVASGTTYTVQQGDTLYIISLKYGVTVNAIAAANNITDINQIFINQQLIIPSG